MIKKPPSAGLKSLATITALLGGTFTQLSGHLSPENQQIVIPLIPLVTPVVTLLVFYLYNHFIEPPEEAEYKSKLRRDIKNFQKCYEDPMFNDEDKEEARKGYVKSSLLLSSFGNKKIGDEEITDEIVVSSSENKQSE